MAVSPLFDPGFGHIHHNTPQHTIKENPNDLATFPAIRASHRCTRAAHVARVHQRIYDDGMTRETRTGHLVLRIPHDLKERLVECAEALTAQTPGRVTLTDLMLEGAELVLAKYALQTRKPRKKKTG
jgi:hypothetical protein